MSLSVCGKAQVAYLHTHAHTLPHWTSLYDTGPVTSGLIGKIVLTANEDFTFPAKDLPFFLCLASSLQVFQNAGTQSWKTKYSCGSVQNWGGSGKMLKKINKNKKNFWIHYTWITSSEDWRKKKACTYYCHHCYWEIFSKSPTTFFLFFHLSSSSLQGTRTRANLQDPTYIFILFSYQKQQKVKSLLLLDKRKNKPVNTSQMCGLFTTEILEN